MATSGPPSLFSLSYVVFVPILSENSRFATLKDLICWLSILVFFTTYPTCRIYADWAQLVASVCPLTFRQEALCRKKLTASASGFLRFFLSLVAIIPYIWAGKGYEKILYDCVVLRGGVSACFLQESIAGPDGWQQELSELICVYLYESGICLD